MVGLGRVELPTSPLSGVRSNQLSYRPIQVNPPFSLIRRSDLTLLSTLRQGVRSNQVKYRPNYQGPNNPVATTDLIKQFVWALMTSVMSFD